MGSTGGPPRSAFFLFTVSLALAGAASAQPGWRRFEVPATGAYVLRYTTLGGCLPSDTRLCLHDGRFAVEAQWATASGTAGSARAASSRTRDSGLFWFFEPDNWELQVKVLDGCALTGHFWVFAAASTNVEYTLTVTDLVAGGVPAVYHHPGGPPAPAINDVQALPCP